MSLDLDYILSRTRFANYQTRPPDCHHLYFDLWFRVDYWEKGQYPSDGNHQEFFYGENPRVLRDLEPETTYCISISTVTVDGSKKMKPDGSHPGLRHPPHRLIPGRLLVDYHRHNFLR